ncbi:uncharacterized protein FOMMEDRAFT_17310 [Fomitiporia mediterranea MF3/22]|uniref:uncharacterized protein n=1 Tax=Fomitiporia mediterranea (strain MF3/22) TaxID=694068 RepID=UPI0004408B71|nr:uncharacterized protein FOMMEDRAFT_17310 [Fomitiporia mediterranea MF3/22]EJD06848.1 hypothetical protein FOMMEDRAFT_17310 [Fomitiporia mediterranea MF3/22]
MIHDLPDGEHGDSQDTASIHPPPSYRSSLHLSVPRPPISGSRRTSIHPLPSRPPVEHVYSLYDSRNAPWATLKLISNVASPRFLPAYFQGQTLHGALELDLRKPESILGISITISGTIIAANAPEPRIFWELSRDLWNTSMGDPRTSAQSTGQDSTPQVALKQSKAKGKSSYKLVGKYSWPFAIPLPSECTVTWGSKLPPVTLPLPPSFSEKGASQFINYEIIVRIRRGPLRIDSKLGTQLGFAPRTRAPAPSLLRQLAYQENRPLVGPEGDPHGWTVLPPILVRGKIFGARFVEAVCTFALALPLSYSRGQPVPLMLTVSCNDSQALDLVFTPQNTSVHLIREVCYDNGNPDSRKVLDHDWGNGLESSPADRSLGFVASSASNLGFTPRAFLPRAAAQQASSSSSASATSTIASLARSQSMYSQPSASASTPASNTFPQMASSHSPPSSSGSALSAFSFKTSKAEKKAKSKSPKLGSKLALHGARTHITSAVWWPRSGMKSESGSSTATTRSRRMEGEILLPKDLVPSFEFGGFSVKVCSTICLFVHSLLPATFLRGYRFLIFICAVY